MEEWMPIPDYEGVYEISDQGRVKRIKAARGAKPGRILKGTLTRLGYVVVSLSKDNTRAVRLVHQLVAHAFIGQCPAGYEINHRNGKPSDNSLTNLHYVTHRENQIHASRKLGTLRPPHRRGESHHAAKLTEVQVRKIRQLAATTNLTNIALGKMFGVSDANISYIIRRKAWTHIE